MEKVKSLAGGSSREYWKVDDAPIQVSVNPDGGGYKIHINREKVRIEQNRIIFQMSKDSLIDLKEIIEVLEEDF